MTLSLNFELPATHELKIDQLERRVEDLAHYKFLYDFWYAGFQELVEHVDSIRSQIPEFCIHGTSQDVFKLLQGKPHGAHFKGNFVGFNPNTDDPNILTGVLYAMARFASSYAGDHNTPGGIMVCNIPSNRPWFVATEDYYSRSEMVIHLAGDPSHVKEALGFHHEYDDENTDIRRYWTGNIPYSTLAPDIKGHVDLEDIDSSPPYKDLGFQELQMRLKTHAIVEHVLDIVTKQ
jgi:hypothetical protein